MPKRKKSHLAKVSKKARNKKRSRIQETNDEQEIRRDVNRERQVQARSQETRLEHENRLEMDRLRHSQARRHETEQDHEQRCQSNRSRMSRNRQQDKVRWHKAAYEYDQGKKYDLDKKVVIGAMNKVCQNCHAKRWVNESPGMCCANGKVKLETIATPPDVLHNLLVQDSHEAKQFRKHIWKYNAAFTLTSLT